MDKPPIIKNEIKLTAFIMSKTNVFFIPAKKILAKNPIRLDKLIKDMLSKSTDKNLSKINELTTSLSNYYSYIKVTKSN